MKNFHVVIFIFFLISCNGDQEYKCIYSFNKLLRTSNKLIIVDKYKDVVLEIRDRGIDSLRDGEYYFDSSGNLKSYKFFGSDNAYTYNEEYDSKGNIVKAEGNPLVYQSIKELKGDSILCKFYFFALNKNFQDLQVYINKNKKIIVPIEDDTVYTNMKIASFGLNYQNMDSIIIFLRSEYKNICSNKVNILYDSLSLYRNDN